MPTKVGKQINFFLNLIKYVLFYYFVNSIKLIFHSLELLTIELVDSPITSHVSRQKLGCLEKSIWGKLTQNDQEKSVITKQVYDIRSKNFMLENSKYPFVIKRTFHDPYSFISPNKFLSQ